MGVYDDKTIELQFFDEDGNVQFEVCDLRLGCSLIQIFLKEKDDEED